MFNPQKAQRDSHTSDPIGSWREELKKHAGEHAPSKRSAKERSLDVDLDAAGTKSKAGAQGTVEKIISTMRTRGGADTGADSTSWQQLTQEATTHSDALRAALDAQQQAQSLLERATTERAEAAGQAEQILLEAQAMAARLNTEAERNSDQRQRETEAWVNDQRRAGEEIVVELREAAIAEADEIRARALEEALAEADAEAAQQVARAVAAAKIDADAVRERARDALEQSSSLVAETQVAMHMFNDSVSSFMVGLQRRAASLEELLEEVTGELPEPTRPEDIRIEFPGVADTTETEEAEDAEDAVPDPKARRGKS